jgi:hypothetical protein
VVKEEAWPTARSVNGAAVEINGTGHSRSPKPCNDRPEAKEKLIRARLSDLGFELERDGFDYSIRDRREKHDLPALQPTRCRDLEAMIELFKLKIS